MKKKKGFLDGYQTYDTAQGFGNASQWERIFQERMHQHEARQIIEEQAQSPHQLLGVLPTATQSEIRKAYIKLIMEWHPDRNPHRIEEAEQKSKQIIAAYTLLKK